MVMSLILRFSEHRIHKVLVVLKKKFLYTVPNLFLISVIVGWNTWLVEIQKAK